MNLARLMALGIVRRLDYRLKYVVGELLRGTKYEEKK